MAGEFFKNGQISVRVKLVDPDVSGPLPIEGTLTIDSITNAVHIVLDSGNININSLPNLVISSLPSVTIGSIPNLVINSIGGTVTIAGTLAISSIGGIVSTTMLEPPVSLTISPQTTVNVANVDILLLAANPNRKYLIIRNYSNSNAYVYIHLGATAATVGSGIPLKQEEWYEFPKGFIYTGQIRAISGTAALKEISITEGT